jgi:hypothetical protein
VGDNATTELQPQGKRVGWIDGDDLYLEPDAAHAEAQKLAMEQGDSLPVTPQTLRRRLREKGLLRTTDERRQKLTVRRTLQDERREVLHLSPAALSSPYTTGPTGPEDEAKAAEGPVPRAGSWAGNGQANGEAAHERAGKHRANGLVGRKGRSDKGEEATAGEIYSEQQAAGWGAWQ